jgi:hypothetical protein
MRRPGPTDALTHRADPLQDHGLPYKNEFPSFNPFQSLLDALGYGQAIWTKVTSLPPPDALQLMDLTFFNRRTYSKPPDIVQLRLPSIFFHKW